MSDYFGLHYSKFKEIKKILHKVMTSSNNVTSSFKTFDNIFFFEKKII